MISEKNTHRVLNAFYCDYILKASHFFIAQKFCNTFYSQHVSAIFFAVCE